MYKLLLYVAAYCLLVVAGVQSRRDLRSTSLSPDPTSTTASQAPQAIPVTDVIESEISRSLTDKRRYRRFTLSNGLDTLIVSDPFTNKAAAAMDCGSGYFSDPEDVPGIAHFLEHMLFLGTKKFPDEDDYSSFLVQHGGSDNAYTGHENTCFFFDVQPAFLEPALDKFSQFFTSPLMTESATKREMNAINNEHSKNLNDDDWRLAQLQASLASPDTPYHKFGTGNLETLTSKPTEAVRQLLLDYYHAKYVAENLRLVVLGKESLDDLQAYVSTYFSGVPQAASSSSSDSSSTDSSSDSSSVSDPSSQALSSVGGASDSVIFHDRHTMLYKTINPLLASRPLTTASNSDAMPTSASRSHAGGTSQGVAAGPVKQPPSQSQSQPAPQTQVPAITRPALVKWQSIEDTDNMVLVWTMPPQTAAYRTKALDYVGDLLCYSGDGGLEHTLKNKGLIHGLSTDVLTATFFTEFSVHISMTKEGLNYVDDVAHSVYAYLDLINRQGISDWRYNETQFLTQLLFDYKDTENPYDYVSDLASRMRYYPKEQVLTGPVLYFEYDATAVSDLIVQYLVPSNMIVYVGRKDFGPDVQLPYSERWYGTKFDVIAIANHAFVEQHKLYSDSSEAPVSPNSDGTPSPDTPPPLPAENGAASTTGINHLPIGIHHDSDKHKNYQVTKHMIIIANSNGLDAPKEDPNALLSKHSHSQIPFVNSAADLPSMPSMPPLPAEVAAADNGKVAAPATAPATAPTAPSSTDPTAPAPASTDSAVTDPTAPASTPAAPAATPASTDPAAPASPAGASPAPASTAPPAQIPPVKPDNSADKNKRYEVTKNMVILANSNGNPTPDEPLNAAHGGAPPSAFTDGTNGATNAVNGNNGVNNDNGNTNGKDSTTPAPASLIEVSSRVRRSVQRAYHGDLIRRWVLPPTPPASHIPPPITSSSLPRFSSSSKLVHKSQSGDPVIDFDSLQLQPANPYVPHDLSVKPPFNSEASSSYINSRLAPVPTSPAAVLGHSVSAPVVRGSDSADSTAASNFKSLSLRSTDKNGKTNSKTNSKTDEDTTLTVAVDLDSIPLSDVSSQWPASSVSLALGQRVSHSGVEPEVVASFVCDEQGDMIGNGRFLSAESDTSTDTDANSPTVTMTNGDDLTMAGDPVPVRVYTTSRAAKITEAEMEEKQRLAEQHESPFTYPVLINETVSPYHFRVWFKQDVDFLLPRVILTARLWTPTVYESAKAEVLTSLYVSLVGEVLDSIDSLAAHAGYLYSITSGRSCIDLTIRGFNGGMRNYVKDVVKRMVAPDFAPTQIQFQQAVAELGQDYRNDQYQSPREYAAYIAALALRSPQHTTPQLLRALNTVTLDDVMTFARYIYSDVALEALLYGNLYPDDAIDLVNDVSSILDFSTSSPAWNNVHRTVRLGRSAVGAGYRLSQLNSHYTVQTTMPNDDETNSAIYNYYQLPLGNRIDVMYASLLSVIAERPCYTQLRTKEQLAYIVWSEDDTQLAVPAFSVRIQSGTRSAAYLSSRVNAFLDNLRDLVSGLSDDQFLQYIETLVTLKLQPAASLSQQSDRYWAEISGQGYNFRRRSHQVALLETGKINKEGLLSFFDFMFGFTPPVGGGMISVQVDPSPEAKKGDDDEDGTNEAVDTPDDDDSKSAPAPSPAPASGAKPASFKEKAKTKVRKERSKAVARLRSVSEERSENDEVCEELDREVKIARGEWRHVPANFTDPESPYNFKQSLSPPRRSLLSLSAQRSVTRRVSHELTSSSAVSTAVTSQQRLRAPSSNNPSSFHPSRATSHPSGLFSPHLRSLASTQTVHNNDQKTTSQSQSNHISHRTHVRTSETYSLYVSTLSQLSDSMSLYALPAVAPTPEVYEL